MAQNRRRFSSRRGAMAVTMVLAAGGAVAAGTLSSDAAVVAGGGLPAPAADTVGVALPTVETPPAFDDDAGGNADADSPAVWVNPRSSKASLLIGTLKDGGMSVYDLAGKEIQHVAAPAAPGPDDIAGRLNNVDVLYGIKVGGSRRDLAVVTDRGRDQLRIFRIDAKAAEAGRAPLVDITDPAAPFIFSADQAEVNEQNTAYGIATFQRGRQASVLVTREHTTGLGLVRLVAKGDRMSYRVVRKVNMPSTFTLPDGTRFTPCEDPGDAPQSEGMVVDAAAGVAYVAQEDVGVWRMDASLKPFKPTLVDKVKEFGVPATFDPATEECVASGADPGFGGEHLSADVEGLAIYHRGHDKGYLMASSQGDSTFAVYRLEKANSFLGSFRVGDSPSGVDGVQHTDSLAVTNVPMGAFDKGLAVFADGSNTPEVPGEDGEPRDNTNFKLVPWENVARAVTPPLKIDPKGFDPRG